jgi:hypothetical protein
VSLKSLIPLSCRHSFGICICTMGSFVGFQIDLKNELLY